MVNIEVDKVVGDVPFDCNIIEAAKYLGIDIPHFCYHKKLSIAANCRMCLVQIEGSAKLVPACATKVSNNMKILTRSELVLAAQKAIMEFLLINHPLDCPICDQGGECELQDISISYGSTKTRFLENKRLLEDVDLGPLVVSNMSRCIMCTRCIRFGTEIAGVSDLGKIGRGVYSRVTTFLKSVLRSNISTNIIDICPVGALCSKPFRFSARSWELKKISTISPHDCFGSNIYAHVKDGKIYRITPKENDLINEVWISDYDRFGFEGIYHESRLRTSLIKKDTNELISIDYIASLEYVVNILNELKKKFHEDEFLAFISPNSSLEEIFLFYKLFTKFGISKISSNMYQTDYYFDNLYQNFNTGSISLIELETFDYIFFIESNFYNEQPLLCVRINKQKKNGGKVISISTIKVVNFVSFDYEYVTDSIVYSLNKIYEGICFKKNKFITNKENFFDNFDTMYLEFANFLLNSKKSIIILGSDLNIHPQYSKILMLCVKISKETNCTIHILQRFVNNIDKKLNFNYFNLSTNDVNVSLLSKKRKVYILFNLYPEYDMNYDFNIFSDASFILSFSSFYPFLIKKIPNLVIPILSFYESKGSYINISGFIQKSSNVSSFNVKNVNAGWSVLVQLSKYFNFSDFNYNSLDDVWNELVKVGFVKDNLLEKCNLSLLKTENIDIDKESLQVISDNSDIIYKDFIDKTFSKKKSDILVAKSKSLVSLL